MTSGATAKKTTYSDETNHAVVSLTPKEDDPSWWVSTFAPLTLLKKASKHASGLNENRMLYNVSDATKAQELVSNTHHSKTCILQNCTHDRMSGAKAAKRSTSGATAMKTTYSDDTNHAVVSLTPKEDDPSWWVSTLAPLTLLKAASKHAAKLNENRMLYNVSDATKAQGLVNNTHHSKTCILKDCTHDRMSGGKGAKRTNSGSAGKKMTFSDETNHSAVSLLPKKTDYNRWFPTLAPLTLLEAARKYVAKLNENRMLYNVNNATKDQIKGQTLSIMWGFSSVEICYHRNFVDTVHSGNPTT